MSNKSTPIIEPNSPIAYQIRLQGHLGDEWAVWFEGLCIMPEENGDTLLTGPVIDQAALYGLLRRARDLGMPLISVNRVQLNPAATQDSREQGAKR
jgi:hypothetical protein